MYLKRVVWGSDVEQGLVKRRFSEFEYKEDLGMVG